jgi:hypothetical protein
MGSWGRERDRHFLSPKEGNGIKSSKWWNPILGFMLESWGNEYTWSR